MITEKWIIKDWAGNDLTYAHGSFSSADDAEEALEKFLGDKYESARGEYVIQIQHREYTGVSALNRLYGSGK